MFSEAYQGGPSVEVFSPHGRDPLGSWKLTPAAQQHVQKEFDKNVRGYVFQCEGGSQSKLQLPKDDKKGRTFLTLVVFAAPFQFIDSSMLLFCLSHIAVALTQPLLVFQLCLPADPASCAFIEVTASCDSERRSRRRLVLSSSFKEVSVHSLHAQLPLGVARRGHWLHLVVDCAALCSDCFQQVRKHATPPPSPAFI